LSNKGNSGGREKRREALGVDHKRLLYCVNVNRTSLDHLLLGESADIDELSNGSSITRDEGEEDVFPQCATRLRHAAKQKILT